MACAAQGLMLWMKSNFTKTFANHPHKIALKYPIQKLTIVSNNLNFVFLLNVRQNYEKDGCLKKIDY